MRGRDTLVTLLWHQRTATVSRRLAPALSHLLSLFHTFHTSCLSLTPLVSPRLAPAVCHALKLPLYHTHTSPFPHSLPLFFVNAHLYVREREREREREFVCVCELGGVLAASARRCCGIRPTSVPSAAVQSSPCCRSRSTPRPTQ
jgi:hypothetical protein